MKSSTCIVGWKEERSNGIVRIWMGGDSQVSAGILSKGHGFEKVFDKAEFLMGVTGDVYAYDLLRHVWTPPERKEVQTDTDYLYKDVVPSFRKLFKDYGHTTITNNQESITENVMFAYRKNLYVLETNFCLLKTLRKFEAVGCGKYHALGACYAQSALTKPKQGNKNIESKIRLAIQAAAEFSMGVDAQITIKHKEWKL